MLQNIPNKYNFDFPIWQQDCVSNFKKPALYTIMACSFEIIDFKDYLFLCLFLFYSLSILSVVFSVMVRLAHLSNQFTSARLNVKGCRVMELRNIVDFGHDAAKQG